MRKADRGERRARTLAVRRRILLGGWFLGAFAVLGRAAQVQVVEGERWREIAAQQHNTSSEVPGPRGTILDRDGVELALTRERLKVSIAPGELTDRAAAMDALQASLGLSQREARRLTDPAKKWVVVPGDYPPTVRDVLASVRGIHLDRELERFYPHGELARGVLGTVLDGKGLGGIEQRYEDVLRGKPGKEVAARDSHGREIPGEVVLVQPPAAGGSVRLTIDLDLQEIAHQALTEALANTGALGGDLLVTDPRTGEVLALVSIKDGRSDALSAINAPYEPGSTLKPFTVAGLLARGLARLDDTVSTGNGRWTIEGRTLTDTHEGGDMTLGDAVRVSSNVGVAKAAQAFTPGQQYENLRDFGFGIETGLPLPGEVSGTLRRPDRWSRQSAVSLAIGYEIGVTPMQMALAYGALANGGELMEPRLVSEVLAGDGSLVERNDPRRVRQVVSDEVTQALGPVLEGVVEDGTATAARLETFRVAGKTGTSRVNAGGGYLAGRYYASFVGYFPADDPQLVVFVKLDSPKGSYYGGTTAAPVTRAMMEGALAARQTPLDRSALMRSAQRTAARTEAAASAAPATGAAVRFANVADEAPPETGSRASALFRRLLPGGEPESRPEAPTPIDPPVDDVATAEGVSIPEVTGLPPRTAVRRLHALGFRVQWSGAGAVAGTLPEAGARLHPGDTVVVRLGGARP